jgi:hypothetical protein
VGSSQISAFCPHGLMNHEIRQIHESVIAYKDQIQGAA